MRVSVLITSVVVCALPCVLGISSHAGDAPPVSEPPGRSHARLSFGVGAGGNGLALCGSYSHSPIVAGGFGAVRAITGWSLDTVEPAEVSNSDKLRWATEVGVLFGNEVEHPKWHAHAAAGVGWTWGEKRTCINVDPYAARNIEFSTLCVPIEAGIYYSPVLPVGLGFTAFGNLNSEKSYVGVLLCLELRRFEPFVE